MPLKIILILLLTYSCNLKSQHFFLGSASIQETDFSGIDKKFNEYQLFTFDTKVFTQYLNSSRALNEAIVFEGAKTSFQFALEPVAILPEKSPVYILSQRGKQPYNQEIKVKTYKGVFSDGKAGFLRLTVGDDFLYGYINSEGEEFYFEPLRYYVPACKTDQFILYKPQDVLENHEYHCFHDSSKEENDGTSAVSPQSGACYLAKLAVLADYAMFNDPAHPGINGVINHIVGVINNVQSNFTYNNTSNFNDGVNFEISELVISTCATCDPLSGQTNAGSLLAEFSSWIDQNGFNHTFNAAHFWTNRDLDNTTVGVAFQAQNLFCQSRARAVFEDWTTNAALLKVTVSHEMGHSFSGVHDASGSNFILSPVVNINNISWSSASKATISGQIAVQGPACLLSCAPTACLKVENLNITNVNNQNFTVSWSPSSNQWYTIKVREAGTSVFIVDVNTSSTTIVLSPPGYGICKKYDIFVYNNCAAAGLSAPTRLLNIGPVSQGCANFSVNKSVGWPGSTFTFSDQSANATSWFWNFGNGQTSTLQNPSIAFNQPGYYNVSLTVNGIHTINKTAAVKILPNLQTPFALNQGGDFESNFNSFGTDVYEGIANVWEFGTSSYVLATQGKAWKSKLNADIPQITSKSALYSPRFDFSSFQNYTLHFDIGMESAFCNAPVAVQLQYSTNNGTTWNRLGTAPSFYNAGAGASCKIAPQIFADTTGWTLNGNYIHKSIDVSFLSGVPSVIFRFSVSISGIFNGGYNVDGVLIDNFRIDAFNQNPLPLLVSSLQVKVLDQSNELKWETFNASDIKAFEILKSADGREFEIIGFVRDVSADISDYTFTDVAPTEALNYYKIKAMLQDGTFVYSNMVLAVNKVYDLVKIFPNPINRGELLFFEHDETETDIIEIEIIDLMGNRVTLPATDFVAGRIKTDGLAPSVYYIRFLFTGGISVLRKFIVI